MSDMDNNNIKINELVESLCQLKTNTPRKIPPLHKWQATKITPFDVCIKDNGQWWHNGTKMTRQSLVDLFASVLWGEYDAQGNKHYYLKTPSDKYQITVEDAPLFICDVDEVVVDGVAHLQFTTTNQDTLRLSDESPLYFGLYNKDGAVQERLYMDTRFCLTACVLPNVVYRLAELGTLALVDDKVVLSLQSGGNTYRLVSALNMDGLML